MRAGRREWIGLGVLALPCLLYSMDLTVLYMAVPKLSADLHPSSVQLLWITDIYGFMLAGLLLTMGSLGDRIGRRRLLLIGAAAFGATSLLAAFSSSASMLIVARALLGIAGATLAPSTLSLLRDLFADEGQRTFAIGVWIASFRSPIYEDSPAVARPPTSRAFRLLGRMVCTGRMHFVGDYPKGDWSSWNGYLTFRVPRVAAGTYQ